MSNKFPGKRCHKVAADMTTKEHILHRIYMNAHKKDYNKRQRAKFVGPPNLTTRFGPVKGWMGPPKPRDHNRKRSAEYYRKKFQRARDQLKNSYIKTRLCRMIPMLKRIDITPELINLKRQQLRLWRLVNG